MWGVFRDGRERVSGAGVARADWRTIGGGGGLGEGVFVG